MSAVTQYLPRRALSRLVGRIAYWQGPRWLVSWVILLFARAYKINLQEAELNYWQYPSLGDFFIRRLRPGLRPVGPGEILHPSDSVITQAHPVVQGQLIQAKGKKYDLNSFLQDPQGADPFVGGVFLTYYLCPTDYHRVHSPVTGEILKIRHIPGDLWPVNNWSTENISQLFCQNERLVVYIQTPFGVAAVVFVGATNVGSIALSFDTSIQTNANDDQKVQEVVYDPPVSVEKGQELGWFRMGSTAVVVYPESLIKSSTADFKDGSKWWGAAVKVNADLSEVEKNSSTAE
ncbi:MAG: archaetidylserine decarboxylase [Pseudobdellovibrionaceae bacterium]